MPTNRMHPEVVVSGLVSLGLLVAEWNSESSGSEP